MARRSLASPSSDGIDVDHWAHLGLEQRQREPSVENFDPQKESPAIVEWIANRLHEKLSEIDTHPRKWMTQDELYYMAKAPDLWPWQHTNALTPTPPDTPNSTLAISNAANFAESSNLLQNCKEADQTMPSQHKEPSYKPPRQRHDLRKSQSSMKRARGGVHKKEINKRKHTMITRSRCHGRCCQKQMVTRKVGWRTSVIYPPITRMHSC
jgi:hypothetical protein